MERTTGVFKYPYMEDQQNISYLQRVGGLPVSDLFSVNMHISVTNCRLLQCLGKEI